ncbi:hypothetical protein AB0E88_03295 [Streptomyces sp. NPDC028635]|uniref:hypothetical protein n=1 Tax=Streptomyces sp. NPDC028635 TaxID=3154800 RepID=UPI0033D88358
MDWGGIRRRTAVALGVLTAAGLFALAAPGSAEAAAAPTRCGGHRVATLPFSTGSVQVFRSDGYVCAITVPRRPGPRQVMSVGVQARGGRPVVDKGPFIERAGPVTVHAGHRCVRVTGSVGGGTVNSGWILC